MNKSISNVTSLLSNLNYIKYWNLCSSILIINYQTLSICFPFQRFYYSIFRENLWHCCGEWMRTGSRARSEADRESSPWPTWRWFASLPLRWSLQPPRSSVHLWLVSSIRKKKFQIWIQHGPDFQQSGIFSDQFAVTFWILAHWTKMYWKLLLSPRLSYLLPLWPIRLKSGKPISKTEIFSHCLASDLINHC